MLRFKEKGAWTEMEIVAVTCKIDSAVKFGIVFCCLVFELKGEGEVLLYVGVGKIVQSAFGCGVAQSIVKKYLSSWFSIDFGYKMTAFRDSIAMEVYDHLDIRIFLKIGLQDRKSVV